jgi:hypothetical protein
LATLSTHQEVKSVMTLSLPAEPFAPDRVDRDHLAVLAYLSEVTRGVALDDVPALATPTRLYSVWDDPELCDDHAPRRSEGWPLVVCKEGSD